MIVRLHRLRLVEHWVFAAVFTMLVVTGLAQRFHTQAWAQWTVNALGGIDTMRAVHRSGGIVCTLLLAQHLLVGICGILFLHWRPSMMINKKDFTDAIHNLRYYFGKTPTPARCDRYDYKQKFEYWGVVFGGLLMAATGLILWFPTLVFKLAPFLPGQVIAAARVAHSNESMLALLVIVTWHIYNAVFSPEVFPLDTTIFTGKISRERMLHEHPLELERLEQPSSDELR
ncbi:MAG: cytochrome b/b6 domain-containing protein [Deltaproteobacteria bacterium]|nr:cytochrome b/b6 domain-containing protein [Deltaproteobacteria bacterium]